MWLQNRQRRECILILFCSRRNDKAQSLRVKWLEACVDIYKHHPESVPELIGKSNDSLRDLLHHDS